MLTTNHTCQDRFHGKPGKTALAISVALGLGGAGSLVSAALTSSATLSFTLGAPGVVACDYGTTPPCKMAGYNITDIVGSYFSMDTTGDGIVQVNEKTPIGSFNGIHIGTTQGASGSHSGIINGSESPNIDNPWTFFGNTGMHQTISAPTVVSSSANGAVIDLSGWNVTWNGIASIPLVALGNASTACATGSSCSDSSSYTLDAAFHVNGAGFTSVGYTLHLEGTVTAAGSITATPDTAKTIPGNTVNINVIANDAPANDIDPASVTIASPATTGLAAANTDGTVDYNPQTAIAGSSDAFDYTVGSLTTFATGTATVTVAIEANVAPVAVVDTLAINTVALDNAGGSVVVDVLANDNDSNNTNGLPGGINPSSVTIIGQTVTAGTCVANANGTVTYSQSGSAVADSGTCTYRVSDVDTVNAPLTATANVDVTVSAIQSDWDSSLNMNAIIPVLVFDAGVPDPSNDANDVPVSGSYFSMAVAPNAVDPTKRNIFTTLAPGSDGGMIVGHEQIAANSHQGAPNGTEIAPAQAPWGFFSNTGMGFSKNGGIVSNPGLPGTLQFSGDPAVNGGQGRYQITWNGIPEIDLGGSPDFPSDLGFGIINCSATAPVNPADTNPCADGDFFELVYDAHVPIGDVSGFGGVLYGMKMTGKVRFMDAALQTSNGTFSVETRSTSTALANADSATVVQCIGDCFDYTITGVTNPSVSVVLPLAGGVPASYIDGQSNTVNPVMRVFNGSAWVDFDTSSGDSVLSAAAVSGGAGLTCPAPGNVAYGALTAGHHCVQVTVADNGLNDKDAALGTITDPSGLALPIGQPFVDNRTSSTGGCSLASGSTSIWQAGAWGLLAGLLALLGWRRKANQH